MCSSSAFAHLHASRSSGLPARSGVARTLGFRQAQRSAPRVGLRLILGVRPRLAVADQGMSHGFSRRLVADAGVYLPSLASRLPLVGSDVEPFVVHVIPQYSRAGHWT